MKERKSAFGLVLLILTLAIAVYVWNTYIDKTVDPNYGLMDRIKGVGDGIARRLGRG